MKNITTIKKTALASKLAFASKIAFASKTAMKKITAKITTTALAVFFAVIHLDDELKSPSSAGTTANLVFFAGSVFFYGHNFS